MDNDEQSVRTLVDYCRPFYAANTRELGAMNEFETSYRAESVIEWYTRNCFVYSMLNRALRILESDTSIKRGFLITSVKLAPDSATFCWDSLYHLSYL